MQRNRAQKVKIGPFQLRHHFSEISEFFYNILPRTFIFWILQGAIYMYKVVSEKKSNQQLKNNSEGGVF